MDLARPAAPRFLSQTMPVDLVHGFTTLLSAVPPGHVLHDALDEAWEAADTSAQRWIAAINTGPAVAPNPAVAPRAGGSDR